MSHGRVYGMKRVIGGFLLVGIAGVHVGATQVVVSYFMSFESFDFAYNFNTGVTIILLAGAALLIFFGQTLHVSFTKEGAA